MSYECHVVEAKLIYIYTPIVHVQLHQFYKKAASTKSFRGYDCSVLNCFKYLRSERKHPFSKLLQTHSGCWELPELCKHMVESSGSVKQKMTVCVDFFLV